MHKKILSLALALTMVGGLAVAAEAAPEEALAQEPALVSESSVTLEVDNLAEIEAFYTYTDEEIISMGADPAALQQAREDMAAMEQETPAELANDLHVSQTEARYIKMAIEAGKEERVRRKKDPSRKPKKIDNLVTAGGSLSTAKCKYEQFVDDYSSRIQPEYRVTLRYKWITTYILPLFVDNIVAAWGGGLNTTAISSSAKYSQYPYFPDFPSLYSFSQSMGKEEQPNSSIKFKFPQRIDNWFLIPYTEYHTISGVATFTLYQTRNQGYRTKVVSRYYHRTLSLLSASLGINVGVDGPEVGVSLTPGPAWDVSSQMANEIGF